MGRIAGARSSIRILRLSFEDCHSANDAKASGGVEARQDRRRSSAGLAGGETGGDGGELNSPSR